MGGVQHDIGRDIAPPMAGDLATVDVDHYLAMGDPHPDPPAGQFRWCRVVNIGYTAETVPTHPHLDTTVGIRQRIQEAFLGSPSVGYLRSDPAVVTLERHLLGPAVMLVLDICDRS